MKFLVYSEVSAARIATSMGLPEYSYYFVLRDFLPVLTALGDVQVVEDPEQQVDALYDQACAAGERCLFLSFSPPQKTLLGLRCPTTPVFAWEFDSIPTECWLDERQQDWRYVLNACCSGITHSQMIVDAVRKEMGPQFPIVAIPSPVWDKFATIRAQPAELPLTSTIAISVRAGVVVDSHDPALSPYIFGEHATARVVQAIREHEQAMARQQPAENTVAAPATRQQSRAQVTRRYLGEWYLKLSGVIFTALSNPYDGRKNWADTLTAFCAAFRDTPDATLVFKLGHNEYLSAMHDMLIWMARMPKFQCRVVLLHGYLDGSEFDALIRASAFAVNASHGEGQCLPLMEFLSCGNPAIAPRHSAMVDYMDEDVGFVVDSWLDATAWSHDPRLAYRTQRHQIDWASLKEAYLAAYDCAKHQPERYQQLAQNAIERMRGHCSRHVAQEALSAFLKIDQRVSA